MNKAIFLDRDGTINYDVGYCAKVSDFSFIVGVRAAIKSLNDANYKVIVITNQAGIGLGKFTIADLEGIHWHMNYCLGKTGAKIDKIYYCPHKIEDNCDCRKPSTKLLLQAAKDFDIDLTKSFTIGDRSYDIEIGKKVRCKTFLIGKDNNCGADYLVDSLYEATEKIFHNGSY